MARREDRTQRVQVASLQCGHGVPDTFVLALDVTDATRVPGLELTPSVAVPRSFMRVALAGVHDEHRELVRKLDPAVFVGPAVEQERTAGPAEQRRCLVEDPGRNSDRPPLRPLAGERELERIELELGRRAQCEPECDLERARRAQACAARQVRLERAFDTDRRASEVRELGRDRGDVAAPAVRSAAAVGCDVDLLAVRDQDDPVGRTDRELDAQVDRGRQDEAAAVIRVLADEIDAAGRPKPAAARGAPELGRDARGGFAFVLACAQG
jgi:hypothetical protein